MNILFLTLLDFQSYGEHNIYCDLLRQFQKRGNEVYCISPAERRTGVQTHLEENGKLLKLRIGNTQKTNIIEKGISTLRIESQFIKAVKTYFANVRFDLVIYSTPPITFAKVVEFVKKRDGTQCYLLLKDIFPQNALDIGMMTKSGVKGFIYRHFRKKETKLYGISDRIGCMSPANVDFVLRHNPEVDPAKVAVCPNAIEVRDLSVTPEVRSEIREKYGIPQDKKVFVYGGNLGRPQGIPFLTACLEKEKNHAEAFFLIVGDGTEYRKLETWFQENKPANAKLLKRLPKEDYDRMVAACDVGMIFLDHRFTIPNFPSRLLSYMQAKLPVVCCTDPNTDVGSVCVDGGFGWWSESNDTAAFAEKVEAAMTADLPAMGEKGFAYLNDHYTAQKAANVVLDGLFVK